MRVVRTVSIDDVVVSTSSDTDASIGGGNSIIDVEDVVEGVLTGSAISVCSGTGSALTVVSDVAACGLCLRRLRQARNSFSNPTSIGTATGANSGV